MAEMEDSRILVAGGGVAALETVLALNELSDGAVSATLISPEPEFTYRPLLVREPFTAETADRTALAPALDQLGVGFELASVKRLDPDERVLGLDDGRELDFDYAVICAGAQMLPALAGAHTLWVEQSPTTIDQILAGLPDGGHLDLIVPAGVSWTLPLYEFALMAARRLSEDDDHGIRISLITPEHAPLAIFGTAASDQVGELLELRGVELFTDTFVREGEDGALATSAEGPALDGVAVALPVMEGRPIEGVPADACGFIPSDDHGRVIGLDRVFAAGDGTTFPIKQGGIATQQADAVAETIVAELGFPVDPQPFKPVLRGKLLTGAESVNLRFDVHGGAGEGAVSSDYLWWPPHKVSGRYLAPWLAGESLHRDSEPPVRSIDVEVSLPREWHAEPAAPGRGPSADAH